VDAVILVAGRGERLRPLTDSIPKPLIPIGGRGTLPRLLDQLPPTIDRIVLIVGHLGDQIRGAVGDESQSRHVEYVVQDPLDGTGGAVRQARAVIRSNPFLVINGDDLYDAPGLAALCAEERAVLVRSRVVPRNQQTWQVQNGRIVGLALTPAGQLGASNTGAYLLGHEWFTTAPAPTPGDEGESSLPHGLARILDRVPYRALEARFWMPCGTFAQIEAAEQALAERGRAD
jgi:UDP-N-acetylglucosamine diphosphorylase / glucose-1-phosphate thymidylyltransferase / UDP-N-acetylgalactosamine diphosphorylase / glucosamine-1-phosphate N-acetyltransferase / galactosamine-1-phosphate N-acetyltransferase